MGSVMGLVTVSHGVNLTINHGVYHGVLDGSVSTCPEMLSSLKVPMSHHSSKGKEVPGQLKRYQTKTTKSNALVSNSFQLLIGSQLRSFKMSEKLCLQWNDFQENIKSAFGNLREDNDFTDVTLACEDGQQVEAHKVILAASSPFFQKLLGRNQHPHPLIYMRGMKSEDLLAIVDFLYRGEANVFQENLDSFLAIAEELQLKGLMGKTDEKVED